MSKHKYLKLEKSKENNIIYLFHHIHHIINNHEVHHYGGLHSGKDYIIHHCHCGLHRINKRIAVGDTVDGKLSTKAIKFEFREKCPEGGWHLENGRKVKLPKKKNK